MEPRFSSEFFTGNRQKLRQLFSGTAPIVVSANGLLQRGADSSYAFCQDANFWYLTGIEEPDLLLVMDRDQEYLIVPERSVSREAFDGSVNFAELSRRSGIKQVYDAQAGWGQLAGRLKKIKHVATMAPPPAYVEQIGLYTNPGRSALVEKLKGYKSDLEVLDISLHLVMMRMVKQPEELKAIQAAIDITIAAIKEASSPAKLNKYAYEYELEAEISRGFRRRGAQNAFEPIVASGERACTLHNVANNGTLAGSDLVLMDVGAEVEHYAADISRTRSLSQPSKRQQAVYAAVVEVQKFGLAQLKPGTLIKDYEQKVEQFMGEKLRELGLVRSITHEDIRRFYPHSTSHFLGLNVHDIGDYERPLEPGIVLTCEPGIYIKAEGIGIRIEDDVLITPRGNKVLSAKLGRDL
ncbi:MAG TPA: aminopeptidase P N-terminal domain-containing protein [Candidatus Saccharimonadales bacterium]|jgi:Xaa-Pro aminopeptidase|nr:aminopeptidase P N-terminal domain-containing protein [Candidatus Saccharimonadales bacterium]